MMRLCDSLTLLAAITALALVAAPTAQAGTCSNEQKRQGEVISIDLGLGQLTVRTNVGGGFDYLYQTDANTEFKGVADSLADVEVGHDVEARSCSIGNPSLANRVDDNGPLPPPGGPGSLVVDLAGAPGSEPVAVGRVFGDDSGENLGGYFSDGLAFGDINHDGFDDLIIATPRRNLSALGGGVDILYGRAGLAGLTIDLQTNGAISTDGETRFTPSQTFQVLGNDVASGDFDGDGIDDAILGASGDGRVYVVYGSGDLPGQAIVLEANSPAADQTLIKGGYNAGAALVSCDVNADGFDDAVIGRPKTPSLEGLVLIAYGGSGLRGQSVDLDTNGGVSASGETRILDPGFDQHWGTTVACGDVNGDGFDDVVSGSPRGFGATRGATLIVYGSAARPATIVDLSQHPTGLVPEVTRILGRSTNNWLGTVVATGDVDGDGYADVITGAAGVRGPGDNFAVGEVSVFFGGPSLPGASLSTVGAPGPGELRITGTEEFGEFATSAASADIDGDGFDDLILGAPGAVPFGSLPETNGVFDGALYVLHGGPALRGLQLIDIREVADVLVFANDQDDRFGSSAAAGGDFDGDGAPEYASSASLGGSSAIGSANAAGYVSVISGEDPLPVSSASATRASRAGDGPGGDLVPPADFGPVVRAEIDFSDDDFGSQAMTTATIRRSDTTVSLSHAASVSWALSSGRVGWNGAEVTLHYTDAEIAGLAESRLRVYVGDSTAGPFTRLFTEVDWEANRLTAHTGRLGVFLIAEVPGACGLGFEIALLLPPLAWLRRRYLVA